MTLLHPDIYNKPYRGNSNHLSLHILIGEKEEVYE